MKKKEILGILLRAGVAMVLFTVAIIKYDTLANLDIVGILGSIDNVALVICATIGIYILKALIFVLPVSVIYVAVGMILNPVLAVFVNLAGVAIEVTVTYFLGRFLGGDAVNKLLSKKKAGQKLLSKNLQDKKSGIFLIRFMSAPIDFVSLFYGASNSKYPSYFLFSMLGIAPRVILFTIIGNKLFDWIPTDKIIFVVICCIPVGVVAYLIKKFVFDRKKEAKELGEEQKTGDV